jgi:hypothetical protein
MANITDKQWIEEVNRKRVALEPGMAVVAVWQSQYPQYGCYTVYTNIADERTALRMLMDRSASKAKAKGMFEQMAFFLAKNETNEIWEAWCAYVESNGKEQLRVLTDGSDWLYRQVEGGKGRW